MLFMTIGSLVVKLGWLRNGVAPAVWPTMVIVVSSAWLAEASWAVRVRTPVRTINGHVFISIFLFLDYEVFWRCAEHARRSAQSKKNLSCFFTRRNGLPITRAKGRSERTNGRRRSRRKRAHCG